MSTVFGQAIAQDHHAVYALRDQYLAAAGQVDQQHALAQQLMWEIARHVASEEILVHPLCVKYAGEEMGGKLAEFDGLEHAAVRENLVKLMELDAAPGELQFDDMLEKVLGDLHRHNDSEEASDVPTLEK
ncbi:hypothetical protein BDQ12DRAFT_246866 [Crucibulum laeve]|uniref:Hemerythrin-like domain-containing protein n=1 Tax=Crucibulum laeve TaxID=68775 RepID=A0A5C3LGB3_9AGAR|nr:hypothetical protein BDQ12DRAFT_246866 [Crucibulum laeve]